VWGAFLEELLAKSRAGGLSAWSMPAQRGAGVFAELAVRQPLESGYAKEFLAVRRVLT
jgi:hypothetical protein